MFSPIGYIWLKFDTDSFDSRFGALVGSWTLRLLFDYPPAKPATLAVTALEDTSLSMAKQCILTVFRSHDDSHDNFFCGISSSVANLKSRIHWLNNCTNRPMLDSTVLCQTLAAFVTRRIKR